MEAVGYAVVEAPTIDIEVHKFGFGEKALVKNRISLDKTSCL